MKNLMRAFHIGNCRLINFVNLSKEEVALVKCWRNHKDIRKWMYSDHIISTKEHLEFIKNLKNNKKNFYWLVKNNGCDDLGVVYFNRVDFKNRNAFMGIYSNPKMEKAGSLIMDCAKHLAFNLFGLRTLKLEVIETNTQAIDFYKKNGFIKEGILKDFVCKGREFKDVFLMGIVHSNEK